MCVSQLDSRSLSKETALSLHVSGGHIRALGISIGRCPGEGLYKSHIKFSPYLSAKSKDHILVLITAIISITDARKDII